MAPAIIRLPPYAQMMFQERFRNEGGKFFDAATMKATVNGPAGVKVFQDWLAENKWMPPGVETWDFGKNLSAFLVGDTAMTISWPPYGRWAAGYGTEEKALSWVPKTQIAGKVGYAMPPGGHPQLAAGFALSIAANSKKKVPAYLFIQWLNSKDISMERVQLPYALRDPFRDNHFTSEEYKSRWPEAPQYLAALEAGAVNGLLDLSIIQTDKYEEALRQGISKLWAGEDPQGDPRRRSRRSGTRSPTASASTSSVKPTRRGPASPTPTRPRREPRHGARPRGRAPVAVGGSPVQVSGDHACGRDHPADRAVPDRLLGRGQLPEHQHAGGGHLLQRAAELSAPDRRSRASGRRSGTPSSSWPSPCRSS